MSKYGKQDYNRSRDWDPNKESGESSDIFKPLPGKGGAKQKYRVRIAPCLPEFIEKWETSPFLIGYVHYWKGSKAAPVCCTRRAFGEKDPAMEFFFDHIKQHPEGSDFRQPLLRLCDTKRMYVNVIVTADENGKVDPADYKIVPWAMPLGKDKSCGGQLKDLWDNYIDDGLPLDSIENGREIIVTVSEGDFRNYSLSVAPKPLPLDPEVLESLEVPDLAAFAYKSMATSEQLESYIPKVLGEDIYELLVTGAWRAEEEEDDLPF